MLAETEVIILPYAGEKKNTLLHLLIREFNSLSWTHFRAAVAFVKESGNYEDLLASMVRFAENGGSIEMTLGADIFGPEGGGSEYNAVETLLKQLGNFPKVKFYLYHENNRTFHPKLYLFTNQVKKHGLLVVGSSNWSHGGFVNNIEINVVVKLDMKNQDHEECYEAIKEHFETYWQEIE